MNNNRDAIVINKEIREYTESVFMGLNLRQCVFGILACIVAIGLYLLFSPKLGIEITSWICIIGAFPFAALGFITYQGMNAEQFIVELWHSFLLSKTTLYSKPFNVYYELIKDSIIKQKEGGKNSVKNIRKDQESKERKV